MFSRSLCRRLDSELWCWCLWPSALWSEVSGWVSRCICPLSPQYLVVEIDDGRVGEVLHNALAAVDVVILTMTLG